MGATKCFDCIFFLSFTPSERDYYTAKLAEQGTAGHFFGACTYQGSGPGFIINRYLNYPIKDCPYYKRGYFQEVIGSSCPSCQKGGMVIKRPRKDDQTFIIMSCSRYPHCKYTTKQLQLQVPCRYCDVPLTLTCTDQLICSCPTCHRQGPVPLTIASRPHLFKKGNKCLHDSPSETCPICNQSRSQRHNLLDLEFSKVAQRTTTLINIERRLDEDSQDNMYAYDPRYDDEDADEFDVGSTVAGHFDTDGETTSYDELEERRLHMQEMDEYAGNWERSGDEGWFYEDDEE